jgi:ribosomal-protein-alanine N-acetyltransferase
VLTLTFPSLADDVVVLRPWGGGDVDQQLMTFADPVFTTYSDWAPRSQSEASQRIIDQEHARLRGEQVDFALADVDDAGVLLGGASLNAVNPQDRRASLGYWLAPAARGRGVASRAVRLIAGWAFETLELARLEITCGPDNRGSQRVAERCGFSYEGLLRSHMAFKGGRRDTLVFSLLPGELT